MNEQITVEELRELGCPDGLIIQYLWFKKRDIYQMVYNDRIIQLVEEME